MAGVPLNNGYGYQYDHPANIPVYESFEQDGGYPGQGYNTSQNQTQAISAFYQNGGIPGLNANSMAPSTSSYAQNQGWAQQESSTDTFQAYAATPYSNFPGGYDSYAQDHRPVASSLSVIQRPTAQKSGETRELSEGEFDDARPNNSVQQPLNPDQQLFDPRYIGNSTALQQSSHETAPLILPEVTVAPATDIYGRTVDVTRHKSPSYSPHISPVPAPASRPIPRGPKKHNSRQRKGAHAHAPPPPVELEYDEGEATYGRTTGGVASEETTRLLFEARKEAQAAILNLLPLQIHVEDYVEAGIDEAIIRRQMQDLGMHASAMSLESTRLRPESQRHGKDPSTNGPSSKAITSHLDLSTATPMDNKGEERKDRIARLLAEKAQKSTVTEDPVAAKAKADKEQLLRLKMEALQKSRAARTQKAATSKISAMQSSSSPGVPESTVKAQTSLPTAPSASRPASNISMSRSTSPAIVSDNRQPESLSIPQKVTPPSIPGLFLSGGGTDSPVSDFTKAPPAVQRKRPVASDFVVSDRNKKRFGESRDDDQSFVIDVSEDDSDGNATDGLDRDRDHISNRKHFTQPVAPMEVVSIRDFPPLTDLTPRKVPTASPSGQSTPNTPFAVSKGQTTPMKDLKTHEREMLELKKKIALMEMRKKGKKISNPTMPAVVQESVGASNNVSGSSSQADSTEAASRIEHLIDVATKQVNQDQLSLEHKVAAGVQKAAELKSSEAEERRLRRLKIKQDLPMVEAEVDESRRRLEQLKQEMAKLEASVEEGLKNKLRLAQEMEKLQDDAAEQIQTSCNIEAIENPSLITATPIEISTPAELVEFQDSMSSTSGEALDGVEHQNLAAPIDGSDHKMDVDSVDIVPEQETEIPHSVDVTESTRSANEAAADQSLDAALQEAIAQGEEHSEVAFAAGAFVPCPEKLTLVSQINSDETVSGIAPNKVDHINSDSSSVETDVYVPQEGTSSTDVENASLPAELAFASPPELAERDTPTAISAGKSPSIAPDDQIVFVHDGTVVLNGASTLEDGNTASESQNALFTPYESPLKRFHQFRFHPAFVNEVQGGFSSLTYSNKIDPKQEMCRFELAGGTCNDDKCDMQHFGGLGLADDEILVQLGNSKDYSEADKPRFVAGLRNVLQELRTKKVKDFKSIAFAIAAYRAKFLDDNTRVLLLDDVII